MTAGTRRKSRELAMQMLFQADVGKQTPDQVRATFWKSVDDVEPEVRGFAEDLFNSSHRAPGADRRADCSAIRGIGASNACLPWIATCCAWPWAKWCIQIDSVPHRHQRSAGDCPPLLRPGIDQLPQRHSGCDRATACYLSNGHPVCVGASPHGADHWSSPAATTDSHRIGIQKRENLGRLELLFFGRSAFLFRQARSGKFCASAYLRRNMEF